MRHDATASKRQVVMTNQEVARINGMLHAVRDMGSFAFLILRTRDGFLQCVLDKEAEAALPQEESALRLTGTFRDEPRAAGGRELLVQKLEVLSTPYEASPLNIGKRRMDIAIENEIALRPVSLRNGERRGVFRLCAEVVRAMREFFSDNGFTEIFTPKLVSAGAEGGANIFSLNYFGQKAYLTQSPQFYKQMLVPVFERVFEIAPAFRAEKHNTPRHLSEYISVDLEMGFIDGFTDITRMETQMLAHVLDALRERCAELMKSLAVDLPEITEIPHIRFREAKERVSEKYGRAIRDPHDLEPEEERLIGRLVKEEYGSDFVFVTHYPVKKRPFYAMDDPDDSRATLSFDLLFRGIEVTTGGQRIHDYQGQLQKMRDKGLDPADFEPYLMLHKYGCPPHGGFGMGLERFIMQLIGAKNIRAASMFPRDTTRLTP